MNTSITNRRRLALLLAASLCALAAVGLAMATAQSDRGGEPIAARPPALGAPGGVPAGLADRLAGLRQAPVADTKAVAALDHSQATAHFGLDDRQAREGAPALAGRSTYLIPGNGYVCLSGQDVGNDCQAQSDLGSDRPDINYATCGTIPQGQMAFYGIVPDGVTDLRLHTGDDAGQAIPVINSSYFYVLPVSAGSAVPTSLTWTTSKGETGTQTLDLPPDLTTSACAPAGS
jgi:hypothetical protein